MINLIKSKKAQRSVFWEALILAIFIFAVGILLGYLLEMNRVSKVINVYQQSELEMLDIKIQDSIFTLGNVNCEDFFTETVDFADRVYYEAKTLEDYGDSAKLSEGITLQHKKYDLLRALLWTNALKLKEQCKLDFNTLVYFYEYKTENIDTELQQNTFSKKLEEIKNSLGNSVLLIPIAGNLDLNSINYLKKEYNITSLPTILIDEKIKISSLSELNTIESYLK